MGQDQTTIMVCIKLFLILSKMIDFHTLGVVRLLEIIYMLKMQQKSV